MTSTLDACFKEAEATATVGYYARQLSSVFNLYQKELETTTKELETEEADLSEQRTRFEAERLINFYDELSPDQVSFLPTPYRLVSERSIVHQRRAKNHAIVSLPRRRMLCHRV